MTSQSVSPSSQVCACVFLPGVGHPAISEHRLIRVGAERFLRLTSMWLQDRRRHHHKQHDTVQPHLAPRTAAHRAVPQNPLTQKPEPLRQNLDYQVLSSLHLKALCHIPLPRKLDQAIAAIASISHRRPAITILIVVRTPIAQLSCEPRFRADVLRGTIHLLLDETQTLDFL
jgi:hypothetical protein